MDFVNVIVWCLIAFFVWLLIWGISSSHRQVSERTKAMAWMFLTFEDAEGDKLNETWLQEPGKFAMETEAWRLSREMRVRLSGGTLQQRLVASVLSKGP